MAGWCAARDDRGSPDAQGWYNATADAVRRQLARILSRDPDDVLVLARDHLYRIDYGPFIGLHRGTGADLTISVLSVSEQEACKFGILKTDHLPI